MSIYNVNKLFYDNTKGPLISLPTNDKLNEDIEKYFESNMCDLIFLNVPKNFYGKVINRHILQILNNFFPDIIIFNYIYSIQILNNDLNKKSYHLGISTNLSQSIKEIFIKNFNNLILFDPDYCISFTLNIRSVNPIIPITKWINFVHKYNNYLPFNIFFKTYSISDNIINTNSAINFNTDSFTNTVYYHPPSLTPPSDPIESINKSEEDFIYEEKVLEKNNIEENDPKPKIIIEENTECESVLLNQAIDEINPKSNISLNSKSKKRLTKKEKEERKLKKINNNPFFALIT
jgi:hypothetical protein